MLAPYVVYFIFNDRRAKLFYKIYYRGSLLLFLLPDGGRAAVSPRAASTAKMSVSVLFQLEAAFIKTSDAE